MKTVVLILRSVIPTEIYLNVTCDAPVEEYFWVDWLHPTYPMHDLLGAEVAKLLSS
jgi:hypothetical protein